jgi:sporulation integral membrane protein YlbJ
MRDNRPLGKLLGDAVYSSVSTLLMIGGFVILFSVINRVFQLLHVTQGIAVIVSVVFTQLHIPPQLSHALVSGIFEITLGSKTASQIDVALFYQIVVIGFILAFSGFSVQAQVASILADTDISFKPFFVARCLHGVFASILTMLLWKPLFLDRIQNKAATVADTIDPGTSQTFGGWIWQYLLHYGAMITFAALLTYIAILIKSMKQKFPV